MKQIYSIKASLLENKRLFKGTLTIYDTGCEFISFTRHRAWMWEDISALQAHKSTTTVSGLFGKNHEQPCLVLSVRDFSATFLFPEQQIAYAVHKISVAHATTPVKQVENAHIDEDAHKVELAKQEEAARKAEIARQEEAARKAEIAKQEEAAHKAEIAKQEEATRKAEIAKQEEAARKAEIARQEEAARKAEIARQEEAARKAEIARQEEAARKAEIAKQEEAARKAEIARQEEAARKAEIARQEEARTTALIELKRYVREELAWCKQNIPASFVPVEQSLMNPAIAAKRNGNYLESLQAYFHLIHQEKMIAPGIAHAMFKVLVAAGALRDAFDFVDYIVIVTSKVPEEIALTSPVALFIDMLYTSANQLWAMATKKNYQAIIECAAKFSGNPNFQMTASDLDLVKWSDAEENALLNQPAASQPEAEIPEKSAIPETVAAPTPEERLHEAMECLQHNDATQAFSLFHALANEGLAEAQYQLALLYDNGQGVTCDKEMATSWYQKAAAQGHSDAQYNLGSNYLTGEGTDTDYTQGRHWLEQAKQQGNTSANVMFGVMYENGLGVPVNLRTAFECYLQAAQDGVKDGQYNTGLFYLLGKGITADKAQAFIWFQKAALQGHPNAYFNLGIQFFTGDGVPRDTRQGARCFAKAARLGHAKARMLCAEYDIDVDATDDPDKYFEAHDTSTSSASTVSSTKEPPHDEPFYPPLDLSSLNNEQQLAVKTTDGYVRVIASAGSGKTRALTYRYCYLVNDLDVSPQNIACITFTNKAAREMKDRILSLTHSSNEPLYISTIHSLCVKILRHEIGRLGWTSDFKIMDESDSAQILQKIHQRLTGRSGNVYQMKEEVSTYKQTTNYYRLLDLNKRVSTSSSHLPEAYVLRQRQLHCLDFNDLVLVAIYILQHYDDARTYWAGQFRYVMVDEFQDVSQANYELCKLLSSVHHNLFVVGDPDQLIYTFRGAQMKFFMNFDKTHPNAKTIYLNNNYRSDKSIITAANNLIHHNKDRIKKDMLAISTNDGKVLNANFDTLAEAGAFVAETIERLCADKYHYSDMLVLYRASYISAPFEEALAHAKIPYRIFGGEPFYQREEIKNILAFLSIAELGDQLSLERALNFAHCPITDIEMDGIAQHSHNAACTPYDAFVALHHGETQFADFIHLIATIRKQKASSKVSDLLTFISKAAGFEKKYRRNDTAPLENKEDPWANISMLITNTVGMERNANDNLTLAAYLDEISTFTNMDEVSNQDSVNMMSIHSAKGLEFPVVFCVGWNENIFPDWRNQHGSVLEEERRIAYVAYTRAQHELYVISATYSGRNGRRNNTSRFVWEMKEEVIG